MKLVERRYNDVITDFSCHERETRETREIIRGTRETSSRETREKRVPHNSLVKPPREKKTHVSMQHKAIYSHVD